MGVLFAVSGSAVLRYITLGHLGEHNAWVALVVGGAFAIVAVAMAVLAGDLLCTFDRSTRTATLRHRRLVHSGTETYSWSDIQDAALEKTMMSGSQNSRPSPVYRPAFVMKNGTRVPWTQVYTGDLKRQANCVAAVRAFAGWHTLADEPQAADSAAIKRAAAGLRAARILVFPFLGIFVAVGAWLYVQQVRRYLMWRPERARIVSADIAASHDDKGNTTYRPVLSYAHRYGGGTVIATGATIINMSSSYGWADAIRERFRVGDSVTAYIDPGNPARGFVVRELSWFPLVFVVLPLLMAVFLAYALKNGQQGLTLAAADHVPILDDDGPRGEPRTITPAAAGAGRLTPSSPGDGIA